LRIFNALTLDAGSRSEMDLDPNGNSQLDDDVLGVTNLVANGEIVVRGRSPFTGLSEGVWRLAEYSGTFSSSALRLVIDGGLQSQVGNTGNWLLDRHEANTSARKLLLTLVPDNDLLATNASRISGSALSASTASPRLPGMVCSSRRCAKTSSVT
jgi:hypothetical protein